MTELKVVRFADLPEPEPLDRSQALPDEEISLEVIYAEEPEVAEILGELGKIRNKRHRWKLFPKAKLCQLVGWHARNPRLRSEKAYRMVMEEMWGLLL